MNWNKLKLAMARKRRREEKGESEKQDTTQYLLSSKANRERLLRAIADLENGKKNIEERALIEE
jgi:PHD/YefM family antitoxin component YafN of YafNO toxin-antitoxin module